MKTERRKFYDSTPRATYAANTVTGRTVLVRPNSYAHAYCLAMDFETLVMEPDFVLMKAPANFEVAMERCA